MVRPAEGQEKRKLAQEVSGSAKAARGEPQPATSSSSNGASGDGNSSSSNNTRKAEGEVEQEERQPSKALAQEMEDGMEDVEVSAVMELVCRSAEEADPEEIEGSMPHKWKLKR